MTNMLFSKDLMFRSKVKNVCENFSKDFLWVNNSQELVEKFQQLQPKVVFFDLGINPEIILTKIADIHKIKTPETVLVSFAPHVLVELQQHAKMAGCDYVMTRSEFFRKLPELLK